jgi:hypothetical protein
MVKSSMRKVTLVLPVPVTDDNHTTENDINIIARDINTYNRYALLNKLLALPEDGKK